MQGSGLQSVVPGYSNLVRRGPRMIQAGVTASLANDAVAEALQDADQAVTGNAPRQFHAASTGISSSFT